MTDELPLECPGHWDTRDGRDMAERYVGQTRAELVMGEMSDFRLANAQYLASRNDLDLVAYQTAAKERIRWLSAQLAFANAALAARQEPRS